MNGKHEISVSNRDISFKFTLERNITVVVGNSATGKTTLYELIYEHMRDGEHSGVNLSCDKKCVVLDDPDWKIRLRRIKDSIVFIDEGADFISGKEFAREIRKTDNYYVIFNRENLKELPYSVEEIYEIKRSGRYCRFEKRYNSDDQLVYNRHDEFVPDYLIVEDAKSGFQFFRMVVKEKNTNCVSAKGNSNILKWLEKHRTDKVLIIADGAAFGPYANDIFNLIERTSLNIMLCLPESFEWIILASGILAEKHISDVIENPSEYIFSEEFFSWEKFFTDLLEKSTQGTYRELSVKSKGEYRSIMNRTKAEQVFKSYTDGYDSSDVKIKLKIDHTFRVAEIADRIAEGVGADRDFAWLSGLLHDIGRFEQVKRYGTFYDAVSIDHAELSADILFKDGLFSEFEKALFSDTGSDENIFLNEDKKKLLETVIRLHNKLAVPDGLDDETLMYTRILRDADKADIFRVLTEPPYDGRNERIINDGEPASDKIMDLVKERRCVPRGITKTEFESLVSHCCMAFELEYRVSRDIVSEQGYLDILMNLDAKNNGVRDQLKTVRDEMKKCWAEAVR